MPVTVCFQGVEVGVRAKLTGLMNAVGHPYAYSNPVTRADIVNEATREITAGKTGALKYKLPASSTVVLAPDLASVSNHEYKDSCGS